MIDIEEEVKKETLNELEVKKESLNEFVLAFYSLNKKTSRYSLSGSYRSAANFKLDYRLLTCQVTKME